MNARRPPHVGLLFEVTSSYTRGLIRGVSRYAQSEGPWKLHLLELLRPADIRRSLHEWHCDGIIARIKSPAIAAALARRDIPVINVSGLPTLTAWPWFGTDEPAVCRLAVDHLLARGYGSLAFCGMPRYDWSPRLERLFAAEAARQGISCTSISVASLGMENTPSNRDRRMLAGWVAALPKPAGIMACCDYCGRFVLEACDAAQVAVPDQVGVIGIDNNEEFCGLCFPPMSSVEPNAVLTGQLAAAALAGILAGSGPPPRATFVKPTGVVARRSTDAEAALEPVVAEALRFIQAYACTGIEVSDIVQHVRASRRHLEQQFRRTTGRSILTEIHRVRLETAQRLLGETDWKLARVAARAGFTHASSMSGMFQARLGIRPGEYRRRMQASPPKG